MGNFFRIFIIFLYFCFAIFIKPCEVFAHNFSALSNLSPNFTMETKSKVIAIEESEHYYAIIQNNNNAKIININNKNNDFGTAISSECLLMFIFFNF